MNLGVEDVKVSFRYTNSLLVTYIAQIRVH